MPVRNIYILVICGKVQSQNMVFKLGKILSFIPPPLDDLFIAGVIAATLYFLEPMYLPKHIADQNGYTWPLGPPAHYAFLRRYPELALDYWENKNVPLFSIWMGAHTDST